MNDRATANTIAAIASFFIPGLGQLVQGRILAAFLFFAVCTVSYAFSALLLPLIIAVPFHIWSIVNAAKYAGK